MFMRNKTGIIVQTFCPIFWCLCLIYYNTREPVVDAMRPRVGEFQDIGPTSKCFYKYDCSTIGYFIVGDPEKEYPWIDNIMEEVANKNGLTMNEDVKKMSVGRASDFNDYIQDNSNKTLYSVVWCTDYWDVDVIGHPAQIPCQFSQK